MSIHYHTGEAWQILPDPELKGLHLCHDYRWITTAGAHWEDDTQGYQGGPIGSRLEEGSAICFLRDTENMPFDASLIAAAPALLEALKAANNVLLQFTQYQGGPLEAQILEALEAAEPSELVRLRHGIPVQVRQRLQNKVRAALRQDLEGPNDAH